MMSLNTTQYDVIPNTPVAKSYLYKIYKSKGYKRLHKSPNSLGVGGVGGWRKDSRRAPIPEPLGVQGSVDSRIGTTSRNSEKGDFEGSAGFTVRSIQSWRTDR